MDEDSHAFRDFDLAALFDRQRRGGRKVVPSVQSQKSAAPTDTGKMTELSDGYPWIGDEGHPGGTTDSELWLRNIYLSRILANLRGATLDLFFPGACGDPATRSSFTAELSIDRPADLHRYLAERPEFVAMSSHGLPAGVGRLSPSSALAPGCAWGVLYSVGCNTAQFDAPSLADNGGATGMAPLQMSDLTLNRDSRHPTAEFRFKGQKPSH